MEIVQLFTVLLSITQDPLQDTHEDEVLQYKV